MNPRDWLVTSFIREAVKKPDEIAIWFEGTSVPYRTLHSYISNVVRVLQSAGIAPGHTVAVHMQRTPELIGNLLAILACQATYVPLDPSYPTRRTEYILNDCQPEAMIISGGADTDQFKTQCRIIQAPTIANLDQSDSLLDEDLARPSPGSISHIIYTSGSTGAPKGVAIPHRAVSALLGWAYNTYGPDLRMGILCSTSICFDLSVFEIFLPLVSGGRVILVDNALKLKNLPPDVGVRLINTVPSAAHALLDVNGIPETVTVVNLAGEPLTRRLADQLYELPHIDSIFNLYGPTEDTTYSTFECVARGSSEDITIGRPIPGTDALVLSPDGGTVQIGDVGELYLLGEGLAAGYLNKPDLTEERFVELSSINPKLTGRALRTGDRVRQRLDGRLDFLGRFDQQVKLRGFRIELGEIEAIIRLDSRVSAVAVLAFVGSASGFEDDDVVFDHARTPPMGAMNHSHEINR